MSIDAFPPSLATTTTDDTLDALAGLSTSANTMPFFTGVDTAALTALTPFMRTLLDDPDLATAQATLGITGGGGGAPTDAEYIVGSAHGTLTQERVLTTTPTVAWDLATAGQAKANVPDASITEVKLGLSDVTTQNVSTTAHGLTPKLSGVVTQYLDGTGLWSVPPAGTTYTDEQAQDAVGAMLLDTATIDLTYGDGGPTLQADVKDLSITEAKLTFVDVTTKDATTSTHGLLRKLSGTATEYLDGSGAWTTPAGGGESFWEHSPASSLLTGLLAFWRMEEASGNRVDSVASMALTLQGNTGQITMAAGKTGNALRFLGGASAYLSVADTPTLSVGTSSFTVGCWLYFDGTPASGWGLVGKGDVNVSNNGAEYLLWINGTSFEFVVGNGSSHVVRTYPGVTPTTGTWYFLVGWYDAALDTQYFQVNNGSVVSVANAAGSFDSTAAFEIGRQVGWAGSPTVNMRVDNLLFYKRILSDGERTAHWNSGNALDYPLSQTPTLFPTTLTDHVGIGTESATEWLEVAGAVKLGDALGTTDGTVRWSGTDFEGRKGGAWVSMTGAGGIPPGAPTALLRYAASGITAESGPALLDASGNLILGSATPGTSAVRTLVVGNGTAPTTSPADAVQLWSADRGATAGKAGLHIRTEDGTSHVLGDRVGIGTLAPTVPLQVVGDVRVDRLGIAQVLESGYVLNVTGATRFRIGNVELLQESTAPTLQLTAYSGIVAAAFPIFDAWRYRGLPGSLTTLANDDAILRIQARGYDGTVLANRSALIDFKTTEAWSATAHGTGIMFFTTANGTTVLAENMRLDGRGNVLLGYGTAGANATHGIGLLSGTAPTTSPADAVQLWSADRAATAGKASLHLRTEDGTSHVLGDRVGIGTLTPTCALDVVGALDVSDDATTRINLGLGTMAQQDAGAVAITGGTATLSQGGFGGAPSGVYSLTSHGTSLLWGAVSFGDPAATRTNLGLGTMAVQDANAVAITGGSATGLSTLSVNSVVASSNALHLTYPRAVANGIIVQPTSDEPGGSAIVFVNTTAGVVGSIVTTGSVTAYNTASDTRLKHAITALTGALDVVRALNPVAFRWNSTDELAHGFLAHELMRHVPAAVTGEPDAVDAQGNVLPQQVDHSRLVPWLTACCQELAAQVQALTARVAALEEQLGV